MNYFVRKGYEYVARWGQVALALAGLYWLFITFGALVMALVLAVVGWATVMDIIQVVEDYGHLFDDEDDLDE